MQSKSLAFEKIRLDSLYAVAAVPAGRVTTYKEIGRVLDVMPRHIAYILATLSEKERLEVPWHRVASDGGTLSAKQSAKHKHELMLRLRNEGVELSPDGHIMDWKSVEWTFPKSNGHVNVVSRGPYADPNTPLHFSKK